MLSPTTADKNGLEVYSIGSHHKLGSNTYNYLDNLNMEELKNLATFCDFMDISYLLEIVCAFIANKYVKNKSIEEIKSLNLI